MSPNKLLCPPAALSKIERIAWIHSQFQNWLFCDAFQDLVKGYGGKIPSNNSLSETIDYLDREILDLWDKRRKNNGQGRDLPYEQTILDSRNETAIYEAAKALFLIDAEEAPVPADSHIDYLFILGGSNKANQLRTELSGRLFRSHPECKGVFALTNSRPLSAKEKELHQIFAPNALTEFDVVCRCLEHAYDLDTYNQTYEQQETTPWFNHGIRTYPSETTIFQVYSAPSSREKKYANTSEVYAYFFQNMDIEKGSKLYAVTSQIYVPYQQVCALRFALEQEVEIETVGYPYHLNSGDDSNAPLYASSLSYLQEIKGTIDTMKRFLKTYP